MSAADLEAAVFRAAREGDAAALRDLFASGARIREPGRFSNYGDHPFYAACKHGHIEAVRCMLQHDSGALDIGNPRSSIRLFAFSSGHPAVLSLLIEHGLACQPFALHALVTFSSVFGSLCQLKATAAALVRCGAEREALVDGLTPFQSACCAIVRAWTAPKGDTNNDIPHLTSIVCALLHAGCDGRKTFGEGAWTIFHVLECISRCCLSAEERVAVVEACSGYESLSEQADAYGALPLNYSLLNSMHRVHDFTTREQELAYLDIDGILLAEEDAAPSLAVHLFVACKEFGAAGAVERFTQLVTSEPSLLTHTDCFGMSLLHYAALFKNAKAVKLLLQNGCADLARCPATLSSKLAFFDLAGSTVYPHYLVLLTWRWDVGQNVYLASHVDCNVALECIDYLLRCDSQFSSDSSIASRIAELPAVIPREGGRTTPLHLVASLYCVNGQFAVDLVSALLHQIEGQVVFNQAGVNAAMCFIQLFLDGRILADDMKRILHRFMAWSPVSLSTCSLRSVIDARAVAPATFLDVSPGSDVVALTELVKDQIVAMYCEITSVRRRLELHGFPSQIHDTLCIGQQCELHKLAGTLGTFLQVVALQQQFYKYTDLSEDDLRMMGPCDSRFRDNDELLMNSTTLAWPSIGNLGLIVSCSYDKTLVDPSWLYNVPAIVHIARRHMSSEVAARASDVMIKSIPGKARLRPYFCTSSYYEFSQKHCSQTYLVLMGHATTFLALESHWAAASQLLQEVHTSNHVTACPAMFPSVFLHSLCLAARKAGDKGAAKFVQAVFSLPRFSDQNAGTLWLGLREVLGYLVCSNAGTAEIFFAALQQRNTNTATLYLELAIVLCQPTALRLLVSHHLSIGTTLSSVVSPYIMLSPLNILRYDAHLTAQKYALRRGLLKQMEFFYVAETRAGEQLISDGLAVLDVLATVGVDLVGETSSLVSALQRPPFNPIPRLGSDEAREQLARRCIRRGAWSSPEDRLLLWEESWVKETTWARRKHALGARVALRKRQCSIGTY